MKNKALKIYETRKAFDALDIAWQAYCKASNTYFDARNNSDQQHAAANTVTAAIETWKEASIAYHAAWDARYK